MTRRLRPWSLRSRIVLIAAVLASSAVLLCQAAGLAVVRSSLTDQVDRRLGDFRPPPPVYGEFAGGRLPAPKPRDGGELPSDYRVFFYDTAGVLLPGSLGGEEAGPDLPGRAPEVGDGPVTVPATKGGGKWRVVAVSGPDGMRSVVALPLDAVEGVSSKLLWFSLAAGAAAGAGVMLLGGFAVRVGLRPLTRVERTAQRITDGELDLKVGDTSPGTEVGRLGIAFNTMLDRLRAALERKDASERRLRRFLADAGHELRTPLTSIQGFAELLVQRPDMPPERVREAHGQIVRNAERMSGLVDGLFQLAKLGDGPSPRAEPVDLLSVAADGVAAVAVHRPRRAVGLAPLPGAGELSIVETLGDPDQLAQVVAVLLTNACTHTPPGTRVEVRVGTAHTGPRSGGTDRPGRFSPTPPLPYGIAAAVVEVADDGPGLDPAEAGQVFERFYRARPGGDTGTGLGLSIASSIAEAHGGRLELDTGPGPGCVFRLVLPWSDS